MARNKTNKLFDTEKEYIQWLTLKLIDEEDSLRRTIIAKMIFEQLDKIK